MAAQELRQAMLIIPKQAARQPRFNQALLRIIRNHGA